MDEEHMYRTSAVIGRLCNTVIEIIDRLEGLILRLAIFGLFVYGLVSLLLAHH